MNPKKHFAPIKIVFDTFDISVCKFDVSSCSDFVSQVVIKRMWNNRPPAEAPWNILMYRGLEIFKEHCPQGCR